MICEGSVYHVSHPCILASVVKQPIVNIKPCHSGTVGSSFEKLPHQIWPTLVGSAIAVLGLGPLDSSVSLLNINVVV